MRPLLLVVFACGSVVSCSSATSDEIVLGSFGVAKEDGVVVSVAHADGDNQSGNIKEEEIVFGSFGEANRVAAGANTKAISREDTTSASAINPKLIAATSAPVRDDRLSELENAEKLHLQRFQNVDGADARLKLRLERDHCMGPVESSSSLDALKLLCLDFLELPQKEKEKAEAKKWYLETLFVSADKQLYSGIERVKNSFLHPICYDFMKYMGSAFEARHVIWMTRVVPEALFENYELMTSLTDYSLIDFEGREFRQCQARMNVDFLLIPEFYRTVSKSTLMMMLGSAFEPSKHWSFLNENCNLNELIASEDPYNYPFLSELKGDLYAANVTGIVDKIRSSGLTPPALGALLAYLQESNDQVQHHMTEIAQIWADVHKNSHLNTPDSKKANEEFNERASGPLDNVLYLCGQRMIVDDLMQELEEKKIHAHPTMIKVVPDWFKHLKVLVETPFGFMMRASFASRNQFNLQAAIHPDDVGNCVPLPRLNCPLIKADSAFVNSPFLWSSLWRNIFITNGESWRDDADFINDNRDFETKMRERGGFFIYKDSDLNGNDLVAAWMKLALLLTKTFQSGLRHVRFLASLAHPALFKEFMPKGFVMLEAFLAERKVFFKTVELALKGVKFIDSIFANVLRLNFLDSADILALIEKADGSNKSALLNLEEQCKLFMSTTTSENMEISALRRIETLFAVLGKELTEEQIKFIRESGEIQKLLGFHGRALTRTQIAGLLKCATGRELLKSNQPMLTSLLDYSQFGLKDIGELLGFEIAKIRINTATVDARIKMMCLMKRGTVVVDDPMALVLSLGRSFWSDFNNFKSLMLWELFNPLIFAFDPELSANCRFKYHITGFNVKLYDTVLLELVTVFLAKWVIAQDWYAFTYHVAMRRGLLGPVMTERLSKGYSEYLDAELKGRKDADAWGDSLTQIYGKDESIVEILAGVISTIGNAPLTLFRSLINKSESDLATKLSAPFRSSKPSDLVAHIVRDVVMTRFKEDERRVWLARLNILFRFSAGTGMILNEANESQVVRGLFENLGLTDAIIYKWALELEGVCVERVFRGNNNGPLDIDIKSRIGIIPAKATVNVVDISTIETKEEQENKETKKKNNKKKNNKKK